MNLLKLTTLTVIFGLTSNATLCYAERIAAPVLLKPSDAQKELPKSKIVFSWQKPTTAETPFGYRLLISENSRFNGYNAETDTCLNNCLLFLESKDSLSKTVDVPLNNKVYYWKVQAFSTTEKGLWSPIQTFQTQKISSIVPSIKTISATPSSVFLGNAITFSADLVASALPEKYSVKVNYGSGLIELTGNGTDYKVSQSPTKTGMQTYTIGIYDANGALTGTALTGNFEIVKLSSDSTFPKPNPSTTEKFSYSKISADGDVLADNAREWACVRDNNTGLIWEVKTDDGGLHDKDSKYSWYNPTVENKGTFRSYEYQKWCLGSSCDTFGFVNAVNDERLCGLNEWRLPEKEELITLVYCSDGKYDDDDGECSSYQKVERPTINRKYFAFTRDNSYWTATQNPFSGAFYVGFDEGIGYSGSKSSGSFVRLVHDGK
jgi:hypothetical protein